MSATAQCTWCRNHLNLVVRSSESHGPGCPNAADPYSVQYPPGTPLTAVFPDGVHVTLAGDKVDITGPPGTAENIAELRDLIASARDNARMEIYALRLPLVAENPRQDALAARSGTPREFANGLVRAIGEISLSEALDAIDRYVEEWNDLSGTRQEWFDVLTALSTQFNETYQGMCTICGGNRPADGPCENATCLSRRITKLLTGKAANDGA